MEASAQLFGDDAADATAPAFSFDGDDDTGMFQNNPDEISFATGGIERFIIESDGTLSSTTAGYESLVLSDNDIPNRKYVEDTFINSAGDTMTGDLSFDPGTQLFIASGSALDPGAAFALDPDTGFYLDGTNSVGVSSGGAETANFNADGIQMRNGAQFIGDTGSAAIPSYSFNGDLTTGIFADGSAGEFAFSSGGTETVSFDGTSATGSLLWRGGDGSAATPAMSYSGDIDTGFYRVGTGSVGFSSDSSSVLTMDGTAVDGSLRWRGADGLLASPGISFSGDTNTGIYRSGTGTMNFASDGTNTGTVGATGFRAIDGTAADPSYSFIGDGDTGIYRAGADMIGFSANGVAQLTITNTSALFNQQVYVDEGNQGAGGPAFSFVGDQDTGMYQGGANVLGLSTGGTGRWLVQANGDFEPVVNNTYNIGSASLRAATVFATTFDGTATAAQYSDLAERYTVGDCCELEPGDVVCICDHEDHDICKCNQDADDSVLGVVSANPAFMMNKDAGDDKTAPYIALRGRVPVKICGTVKKGDLLISCSTSGCARAISKPEKYSINPHAVFAKALSANKDGFCEAVIL
jgi:hypothetical protein